MNNLNHRLFGGASWAASTFALGAPPSVVFTGAGLAALTSGGALSPDIDQFKLWKLALTKWPGRLDNWVFGHRRITHWWGWPVLASIAVVLFTSADTGRWPYWALIFGWSSHIVGDWIFGRAVPMTGIPKGVPLLPCSHHVGVGFLSDGVAATVFTLTVVVGSIWMVTV